MSAQSDRMRLFDAVGAGKENVVVDLLESNPNWANSFDMYGWTPLHIAASLNRAELCRTLAQKGAKVSETDYHGETPLSLAVTRGYIDVCRVLVEAGAPVRGGMLIEASKNDDVEICELLVAQGIDVNYLSSNEETPLHGASYYGILYFYPHLLYTTYRVGSNSFLWFQGTLAFSGGCWTTAPT